MPCYPDAELKNPSTVILISSVLARVLQMHITCSCAGTITRPIPYILPCPCTVAQAVDADDPCLNVDCRELFGWDKTLYAQLIDYPGEVIPLFDMETNAMANVWASRDLDGAIKVTVRAAGRLLQDFVLYRCGSAGSLQKPMRDAVALPAQVKMFNLLETKVIRDLNPGDINKLISVGGMVTRASTVIPDLQCAFCRA